ncbi:MAG: hypothetical protein CM15mP83_2790 [Flavobacteriaceae bacterium]|nr:MAG: hypothetical protein CM15mP83_2790 [Flavobacteriaceae bacterium]
MFAQLEELPNVDTNTLQATARINWMKQIEFQKKIPRPTSYPQLLSRYKVFQTRLGGCPIHRSSSMQTPLLSKQWMMW